MSARNRVIAGDYIGNSILSLSGGLEISLSFKEGITLNKDTVAEYTVITEEVQKSAVSGVIRGSLGEAFFGDAGMLAGALSAKNKGVYTIAINFKDGKRSLIEVNEKIYQRLVKDMF